MRGCAPALTVHIKFFHRPGLPRAAWCVSMSKIAQAEYKAKARFLAVLRRRGFSWQRKDRLALAGANLVCDGKCRHKKNTTQAVNLRRTQL